VVLLLTGSIQSAKNDTNIYLNRFAKFESLWKLSIEEEYVNFQRTEPTLPEFELKIKQFLRMADEIEKMDSKNQISALVLKSENLQKDLKEIALKWKETFAKKLHIQAKGKLESVSEMVKQTQKKLHREVVEGDIDALGYVMQTLQEVRAKQSEIELEFGPITQM
jgi:DNA anti-recombination protein RmuC